MNYAEQAAMIFAKLYEEQELRAEKLSANEKKDMTARPLTIGIAAGDGIGPVIINVAERAIRTLLKDEISRGEIKIKNIEGLTIENRIALGQSVPAETLRQIETCDVLLKGPTTTPSGGTMASANVTLRKKLDLFANVRPVKAPSLGIDWTFFRENTEGEYALGSSGIRLNDFMAVDFKVITRAGTRRIARAAYEYAKQNGKTRVTIVTKSNIMKKTDGMFSDICREVAAEYPNIVTDEFYVDIMSAMLVDPAKRQSFQVILAPNLYGDILTDEAAQIQGGVSTAGSANIGNQFAMFEAIHGSAPRLIEEGLGDYADPESVLRASMMLLNHIGCQKQADRLAAAIDACKDKGDIVTTDKAHLTCAEFGDKLIAELEKDFLN